MLCCGVLWCAVQVVPVPQESVMDKILERAQADFAARGKQGRTKRGEGCGSSGVSNKQIEAYISQVGSI
jgi:hypothetical protein